MLPNKAVSRAQNMSRRVLRTTSLVRSTASVLGTSGWLVRTSPMLVRPEEAVLVRGVSGAWYHGVAITSRRDETQVLMFEGATDIRPGLPAEALGEPLTVPVGEALLERVVDPLGRPLDEGPPIDAGSRHLVFCSPPAPGRRQLSLQPLWTGVQAVDAFVTCARGQRFGLIGPAGSGKTTLLRMVCRHARADLVVLALVGERGREVFEAAEAVSAPHRPTIIVAATPHDPPCWA
jgi:flagellar biosynthesis/type III secretory pathway ATPase